MKREQGSRIEAFLRVQEVYEDWVCRRDEDQGEPFETLVERHPSLAEELRRLRKADVVLRSALGPPEASPAAMEQMQEKRRLGDFRLIREIGRGGMGIVFEAEQVSLHRRVALKVLPAQLTLNDRALRRFQHEAETTGRLHHPAIIDVHQIGEADGVHFIVMELVEGSSLDKLIERMRGESFEGLRRKRLGGIVSIHGLGGRLRSRKAPDEAAVVPTDNGKEVRSSGSSASNKNYIETVCKMVAQIADGLDHAHRAGVIHRDVKPSNILVRQDGSAVLTDFGLARDDALEAISRTGDFAGTPNYVSPEQAMGGRVPVGPAADTFSLGATLYELLTLHPAFPGGNSHEVLQRILTKEPVDPTRYNPALAPDLVTIVLKALEKDADRRYETTGKMASDLRAFIEYRPIEARRTSRLVRAWRWAQREPLKAAMAFVVVIAVPLVLALGGRLLHVERQLEILEQPRGVQEAFLRMTVGDGERARDLFRRALVRQPDSVEATAGLALTLLRDEEPEEALQTVQGHPGPLPEVLRRLEAEILGRMGRRGEADALLERLGEPVQPLDRYVEAVRLLYDKPFEPSADVDSLVQRRARAFKAIEHLRHAVFADADRAPYQFALAWASWVARDGSLAEVVAHSIEDKWPDEPIAWFYAGLAYRVADPDAALASFERAFEMDPSLTEARIATASLHLDAERFEAAAQTLEALCEVEPENSTVLANLAAVYRAWGRPAKAVQSAQRAVELDPGSVHAWENLANAYVAMGESVQARNAFRKAVDREPTGARLHNGLGWVLHELGSDEEAREHLERALVLDPSNPHAAYNLALVSLAGGGEVQAETLLRRAIDFGDRNPAYGFQVGRAWGVLGDLLFRKGRYEESIAPLRRALDAGTAHLGAREELVEALDRTDRRTEAIAVAKEWTAAAPASWQAWNWRAWLQLDHPEGLADALDAAEQAVALTGRSNPMTLDTLAHALVRTGRRDEGLRTQMEALDLAAERDDAALLQLLEENLEALEAGS